MSILTVQPCSIDNFLDSTAVDANRGNSAYLSLAFYSTLAFRLRPILNFDFSVLPDGATITSAILSGYYYDKPNDDPVGQSFSAYRLNQYQTTWTEMGSTWNKYDGTNVWASAGGDYTTTDGASVVAPASFGWMDWNVTAQVQYAQVNTSKIAYFLIRSTNDLSGGGVYEVRLYSRSGSGGDVSLRPKLVITYTLPGVSGTFLLFM